jgi:hypothetical protein
MLVERKVKKKNCEVRKKRKLQKGIGIFPYASTRNTSSIISCFFFFLSELPWFSFCPSLFPTNQIGTKIKKIKFFAET